jgi:hypothetical protein
MEFLKPVLQHRPIFLAKHVAPNVHSRVRIDTQNICIESGVVNLAKPHSIRHDRLTFGVSVAKDVRSVEQVYVSQSAANGRVPAISCYISSDARTWLAVAQVPPSSSGTFCGLSGIGTASPGITIVNGTPGWFFYLIAVW